MLDNLIFKAERNANFFLVFVETLAILMILSIVNYFMGGNALFLVSLVSLAFAYPVTKYMRSRTVEELEDKMSEAELIKRHDVELIIFWSIFLSCVFGFYLMNSMILDYSIQERFTQHISGMITHNDLSFSTIFVNNMGVLILTFIISFISIAGLLWVLIWNASVLAYVLGQSLTKYGLLMNSIGYLSHGLIEIAGYVFAGIAAMILANRLEYLGKYRTARSKIFRDAAVLFAIGVVLVFLGAVFEVI